jgi:hypothetical protein
VYGYDSEGRVWYTKAADGGMTTRTVSVRRITSGCVTGFGPGFSRAA